MKSRSVKQKCHPNCDGKGTIHEDNGGDGSDMYPLQWFLRDCPVCAERQAKRKAKAFASRPSGGGEVGNG